MSSRSTTPHSQSANRPVTTCNVFTPPNTPTARANTHPTISRRASACGALARLSRCPSARTPTPTPRHHCPPNAARLPPRLAAGLQPAARSPHRRPPSVSTPRPPPSPRPSPNAAIRLSRWGIIPPPRAGEAPREGSSARPRPPPSPSYPLAPPPTRVLPFPCDPHPSSHTSRAVGGISGSRAGVFNRWSARTWRGHQDGEL